MATSVNDMNVSRTQGLLLTILKAAVTLQRLQRSQLCKDHRRLSSQRLRAQGEPPLRAWLLREQLPELVSPAFGPGDV